MAASTIRLHQLLRDHKGAVRADLLRYYGLDIDEVMEEKTLTPAAIMGLVKRLPQGASLPSELNPEYVWSQSDYLLAEIADRLGVIANLWGAKPPYERIPRPGDAPPDETQTAGAGFDTPEEFDAFYARVKASRNAPAG